jgi:hypothetical protein
VTLAQLRLDARLYSDQRPGGSTTFISDSELTRLVNGKIRELYDLLVEAHGSDYYANEAVINIVAGTSRYDLPTDFYELASVTLEWGAQDFEIVFPIGSVRERNLYQNWMGASQNWSRNSKKGYRLRASQLEFLPEPRTDVACRIQYVPVFADLVSDSDTFDGINGWEKMVALGVAIEMLAIDKRTSAQLANQYAEQLARIETMKTERDAEAPKEIVDERRLRLRNGWIGSRFDNSFDPTFW